MGVNIDGDQVRGFHGWLVDKGFFLGDSSGVGVKNQVD
jgi:hypothetical protein